MLSFDTSLSDALKLGDTTAFWVLKLYYNNEGTQAVQSDGSTANLLNEALDTTETYVDVDYGAAFIAGDFIKVDSEVMEVYSVSSNTLAVFRGSKGTTPAEHNDNAAISFDNWIGVSDAHRVDSVDIYHGLVSSWGNYSQSLDFFNFTTSTGSLSVTLINTDSTISGGRFSDLFSSYNFANRKWELFLNTNTAGTYDTAARMIGTGIISGNIDYNYSAIKFTLLDKSNALHNQIPKNVVDVSTYTNAPKGNINKPIPINYGDSSPDTTALTSGTAGNFDHHFAKGKFPAIITDKWNKSAAQVYAQPDSVVLNTLYDENIYSYKDGFYYHVNTSNADASANDYRVDFSGVDWRVFVPLATHSTEGDVSNFGNTVDGDLTTDGSLSATAGKGYQVNAYWRIPKIPNLGIIDSIYFVIHYKDFTPDSGHATENITEFRVRVGSHTYVDLTWGTGAGSQAVTHSTWWTDAEEEAWNLEEDSIHLNLESVGASVNHVVESYQAGLEVRFSPSQTFEKQIADNYEIVTRETMSQVDYKEQKGAEGMTLTKKVARTRTVSTPEIADYVYVSGKGREYGAFIDTINSAVRTNGNGDEPDPNYAAGALIENPIYMIEDILRTELGLDGSTTGADIDIESFDKAGNAQTDSTKGDIAFLFNDAIADIKFAFSQYKFINSKDLINKICRQCMSFVWFSGEGKFKIKTLLLPGDTWTTEATIDFREINFKGINRTPLNNVRNKIIVNYAYDYARDKMLENTTATDSTSAGTTVNGYNDTLSLEIDADCILDETTADNLRNAYKSHYKDRKVVIDFDIMTPKHNDLEITDFITFSNWDSNLKLYGTAFSSDIFMIQNISKKVNGCSIKAIKVDS